MRIWFLLLLALAACASSPDIREDAKPVAKAESQPVGDSLPAQELEAGECGLFLWTADSPRRFVFFYQAGGETAEAIVQHEHAQLFPVSQSGTIFGQFMTVTAWQSGDGARIGVSLVPGEQVEDGQRVSSARMSVVDAQGWETFVPLVGLRACQPE